MAWLPPERARTHGSRSRTTNIGRMASMLLDRPIDELLAGVMPPNHPGGPGGDEAETTDPAESDEEEDDEEST